MDRLTIPHWAPPTHAMQIWRHAEQGLIKLLWISGTNPAVSLPELARVRAILEAEEPYVVVQDAFLTETARLADVVLPTALWGEKTGTFTTTDRTVHLSEGAVDPPGEARSDLDIFLDYHFHTRTKTGRAPELQQAAPDAWAELSAADAARLGVEDGDRVQVESRRGAVVVAARVTGIAPGTVFVPFHYAPQAANELTLTAWHPVSKQPLYKTAAVRVAREG